MSESGFLIPATVVICLPAGTAQVQWLAATAGAGSGPRALVFDSVSSEVCCANDSGNNVTVIDGGRIEPGHHDRADSSPGSISAIAEGR